ncbi:MAG: HAMP domain-containing sensor histidine kinase [Candidatus Omnitrophota bacterium]|nr:HAMP domain-containing sensor histidine kinase [Candidatus Omnitrophota bacterium]
MRIKVALIFIISILLPTVLLAYFGLQAVRSERSIVERSVKDRYEAMADVIENEITSTLSGLSAAFTNNKPLLESIILDQTALFKDQVSIYDDKGTVLGGTDKKYLGPALVIRRLKNMPYTIYVYERYPGLLERYAERKKALYFYIVIIAMSAVSILAGGAFTLSALSKQWKLAELKSEFASSLSHDLRRPLTSIRMFSEMLKENLVATEEKRREYYNVINSESERLTQLANNILDFSRIETGRKVRRLKEEDIGKLVKETADYFLSYNMDEAHPITVSIQDNMPMLKIDGSAISQAVLNLLSNAAKYSDPGKNIKVTVMARAKDVAIEVADEGVGIPPEEQKKIFRKFYRVHKDTADVEGSGLGLALVKYAAEIHGGRVTVRSEAGLGSKFTLVLPV